MAEVKRDAFSIDEIAERAGLSRDTVEREIARGNLRARKIGRLYRIPERWYLEWLHRDPEQPKAAPVLRRIAPPASGASGLKELLAEQRAARQAHKAELQRKQAGRKK